MRMSGLKTSPPLCEFDAHLSSLLARWWEGHRVSLWWTAAGVMHALVEGRARSTYMLAVLGGRTFWVCLPAPSVFLSMATGNSDNKDGTVKGGTSAPGPLSLPAHSTNLRELTRAVPRQADGRVVAGLGSAPRAHLQGNTWSLEPEGTGQCTLEVGGKPGGCPGGTWFTPVAGAGCGGGPLQGCSPQREGVGVFIPSHPHSPALG